LVLEVQWVNLETTSLQLLEERKALLALSLIHVLCERIDVGVAEFSKGSRFGQRSSTARTSFGSS